MHGLYLTVPADSGQGYPMSEDNSIFNLNFKRIPSGFTEPYCITSMMSATLDSTVRQLIS